MYDTMFVNDIMFSKDWRILTPSKIFISTEIQADKIHQVRMAMNNTLNLSLIVFN